MKRIKKFAIGGIQTKIFNLVAITMLLIIGAYALVSWYQARETLKLVDETNKQQKQTMKEIASNTMEVVAKESLKRTAEMEAMDANSLFETVKAQVNMLEEAANNVYENPDAFPERNVPTPSHSMYGRTNAQLMFEEGIGRDNEEVMKEVYLLGNLTNMMKAQFDNTDISSCVISSVKGFTIVVDNHSEEKFKKDGSIASLNAKTRPWYKGAVETGKLYFTEIEEHMYNGDPEIAVAAPIYKSGEIVAVVEADINLETMKKEIEATNEKNGFMCVINEEGHVVFSPFEDGTFRVEAYDKAEDLRDPKFGELSKFVTDALDGVSEVTEIFVDDKTYYMAASRMDAVGWIVLSAVDKETVMEPAVMLQEKYQENLDVAAEKFREYSSRSVRTIVIMVAILLIIGTVNGQILGARIVKPLNSMAKDVESVSGDNPDFTKKDIYNTNDEIELLADTLESLTARNKDYLSKIVKITADRERISAELNVATQIQADMLPKLFPPFPRSNEFSLFADMKPAKEVGGDFFDFFMIDEDHIGLVMADVSGKGVPAALFMVISKTLIKNRALMGGSPGKILEDVNNQLCEGAETSLFVTVWFAVVNITTGKGLAANAGHEHPVLCRKGEKFEYVKYRHSPALSTMEGMKFAEHEFELYPGDTVYVYTDGVMEAMNEKQDMFGEARLLEALNENPQGEPEEIMANVHRKLDEFVGEAEQFDDLTMMCFKYKGLPESEKAGPEETA